MQDERVKSLHEMLMREAFGIEGGRLVIYLDTVERLLTERHYRAALEEKKNGNSETSDRSTPAGVVPSVVRSDVPLLDRAALPTKSGKYPIDRPCSACSGGDPAMEYHDHEPPFSEGYGPGAALETEKCPTEKFVNSVPPNRRRVTREAFEAGRIQGLEEAATVTLEQRCERDTPWDFACLAVVNAIRDRQSKAGHSSPAPAPPTEEELVRRRVKQYEDRVPCYRCLHVHLGRCAKCGCPQIEHAPAPCPECGHFKTCDVPTRDCALIVNKKAQAVTYELGRCETHGDAWHPKNFRPNEPCVNWRHNACLHDPAAEHESCSICEAQRIHHAPPSALRARRIVDGEARKEKEKNNVG